MNTYVSLLKCPVSFVQHAVLELFLLNLLSIHANSFVILFTFAKTIPNLSILRFRLQRSSSIRLHSPFLQEGGGTLIYTRLVFREALLPQNLGSLWGFKGMITNPLDEALSSFTILPAYMKLSVCLSYMSRGTKAILLLLLKQKLCPPPPLRGEVMFAPKTYIKPEISQSTYVWLTF